MTGYRVWKLIDADGVVPYILAFAAGMSVTRASKVHRLFTVEILIGRQYREFVVADRLRQAEAIAMKTRRAGAGAGMS